MLYAYLINDPKWVGEIIRLPPLCDGDKPTFFVRWLRNGRVVKLDLTRMSIVPNGPYTPERLERWKLPEYYYGANWPDYYGAPVGRSRDSQPWEGSNFAVMLSLLGGESDTVQIVREGHWAVGWIEWIAIHESDYAALWVADHAAKTLEVYPLLDEDDASEREQEYASEVWRDCYDDAQRLEYIRTYRDQFEFHNYRDLIECVRGRYFCGYASELIY